MKINRNEDIAKILYEIGEYLEMKDAAFKPRAYEKAGYSIENLEEEVSEIYKKGGLEAVEDIPGVGISIAEKIEELIKTGHLKYYERLKKSFPVKVGELAAIEGVGPKMIFKLYKKLKVKNIDDLEKAAKAGKIAKIEGFGKKTEEKILKGIEFLRKSEGRFLLGSILPLTRLIEDRLRNLKEVGRVAVAGSIRRMQETVGDLDILVTINNKTKKSVADFFVSMPEVIHVYSKGNTKTMVRLRNGMDADLRVVADKSFGAALQYFTGDKHHNITLRILAEKKGYKLNEYGLWRGKKLIAGKTEEEIYKALGMQAPPPEIRSDSGEIQAALRQAQGKPGGLPKFIDYSDVKGDLHCHSDWDGGANSIEEMAEAAIKMGYQYIGIADHTKFLAIEHGVDEKQLEKRDKEIDKINSKFDSPAGGQNSKFKILKGCEANILADGSIDIKDEALAKLDFVIAGIHSQMKMPKEEMTERIIKAMKNPNVDIISHPTGRILKQRDEYQIDFDKILKIAKETGTILEINANPYRLDLNGQNIHRAKEMGVKMIINADAHHIDQMRFIEFGIAQARRGWITKNDIINTRPWQEMLKLFK